MSTLLRNRKKSFFLALRKKLLAFYIFLRRRHLFAVSFENIFKTSVASIHLGRLFLLLTLRPSTASGQNYPFAEKVVSEPIYPRVGKKFSSNYLSFHFHSKGDDVRNRQTMNESRFDSRGFGDRGFEADSRRFRDHEWFGTDAGTIRWKMAKQPPRNNGISEEFV